MAAACSALLWCQVMEPFPVWIFPESLFHCRCPSLYESCLRLCFTASVLGEGSPVRKCVCGLFKEASVISVSFHLIVRFFGNCFFLGWNHMLRSLQVGLGPLSPSRVPLQLCSPSQCSTATLRGEISSFRDFVPPTSFDVSVYLYYQM